MKYSEQYWRSLIGKKYGRLTIINYVPKYGKYKRTYLISRCDCGEIAFTEASAILKGHTQSCGCLFRDTAVEVNTTHGMSKTRIYNIWRGMISRCEKSYETAYKYYGARGIKVCDEWHDFEVFYKWSMEHGYQEDLSIDRINVNGNYEPKNCRWADAKTQARNTRTNHYISYKGESKPIAQWAEEFGVGYWYFHENLRNHNFSIETVLELPYYKERVKC